jgi:hypothetical protein
MQVSDKCTLTIQQAKGTVEIVSTKMVLGIVRGEAGPHKRQPKALNTKIAQGGHQARAHSDQMFLMMARREARPRERWPKTLKGEL